MSNIYFYPIRWFEEDEWKSIQVIGYLENGYSLYLRIGFRPFFTIKYSDDTPFDHIEQNHNHLIDKSPVVEIRQISNTKPIYRVYVQNKENYFRTLTFVKKNVHAKIIDENQSIKSKFFSERQIHPGLWQSASNLRTLSFNLTSNNKYTSCDLEFYTDRIQSVDYKGVIPQRKNAFFGIKVIPIDDISFSEKSEICLPSMIFAITLLLTFPNSKPQCRIYIVTNHKVLTDENPYTAETEAEIITQFYKDLSEYHPDTLISMYGHHFDLNYLIQRSNFLGIDIPPFAKISGHSPQIVKSDSYKLIIPGISQINLYDFYKRLYPLLDNYKLKTLAKIILDKDKTTPNIYEIAEIYQDNTLDNLIKVVKCISSDIWLLYEIWNKSNIENTLSEWSNFWRTDAEDVITFDMEILFEDLLRYFTQDFAEEKFHIGKLTKKDISPAIYHNISIYNLSKIYIYQLKNHSDILVRSIAEYFENSKYGHIPFNSGYFSISYDDINNYIAERFPDKDIIWIKDDNIALINHDASEIMDLIDFSPLMISTNDSWIYVNRDGLISRKGLDLFVRPPFQLIDKYVNYILEFLISNPQEKIELPMFNPTLSDFILETKVTSEDFLRTSSGKDPIIQQLRECELPIVTSLRKIRYIQTVSGPVIEDIFVKNHEKYASLINIDYYNEILQRMILSIFPEK